MFTIHRPSITTSSRTVLIEAKQGFRVTVYQSVDIRDLKLECAYLNASATGDIKDLADVDDIIVCLNEARQFATAWSASAGTPAAEVEAVMRAYHEVVELHRWPGGNCAAACAD